MSTEKDDPRCSDAITPAQMRAGRALLGWTQAQLALAARVGLSTVKDAETGKRSPTTSNTGIIRQTLERGGVTFVAANGDGPGVRLRGNRPEIIRRPFRIKRHDTLAFLVRWRGAKVMVEMPISTLDRLDNGQPQSFTEYLACFRRYEQQILEISGRVIEAGRFTSPGFVELAMSDFS